MRTLNVMELDSVSGGDWSITVSLGNVFEGTISGTESIQEIVGGAYGGAVDAMANFFTWSDPAGYYSSGC